VSKAYLIYIEISLFDAVVAKTSQIDMVFLGVPQNKY
jgi:hypothetical protein